MNIITDLLYIPYWRNDNRFDKYISLVLENIITPVLKDQIPSFILYSQ